MMPLSAIVLVFALMSALWFGVGFAVVAQGLVDGSMRDHAHLVVGLVSAVLEAATAAGWLWALFASARAGSPVSGPVQVMCGATAAVQFTFALASAALTGGHLWDEPSGFFLGHAVVAALLAILIRYSRSKRAVVATG